MRVAAAGKQIDVTVAGKPFTSYHFDPAFARPFLYPVFGPGQHPVTRNYPMQQLLGEDHDHPHHRSWWTAYGEVNGVDDWSEERGHGFIRHQAFRSQTSGPVFGGFVAENLWTDPGARRCCVKPAPCASTTPATSDGWLTTTWR